MHKMTRGREGVGLHPDPAEGAYSAPSDSLVTASALLVFFHFSLRCRNFLRLCWLFWWNFQTTLNLGFTVHFRSSPGGYRDRAMVTRTWRCQRYRHARTSTSRLAAFRQVSEHVLDALPDTVSQTLYACTTIANNILRTKRSSVSEMFIRFNVPLDICRVISEMN